MRFIIKLQAEIAIKSRPVRKRFTKILESNIKNVLRRVDELVTTRINWDTIEVNTKNDTEENRLALVDTLTCIPGVAMVIEVQQRDFTDLHDIYEKTLAVHKDQIVNKTFCVRVKRTGDHDFSSLQVEQYVGGGCFSINNTPKIQSNSFKGNGDCDSEEDDRTNEGGAISMYIGQGGDIRDELRVNVD